ncbi:AMP-binding protein [Mycolicibacterium tusciae]|uniref:Acyl-CoA synthetase n=1 Tax=Mycolicibacterium tusciae TaxID=75922 RepID=A0A1X0JST7_9MYCO|nr:AMP-binding protein [Mycolicibacterium tusciae]ORB65974.1 acyl-CoA synthetase [Mycolicibacterium tusciae]
MVGSSIRDVLRERASLQPNDTAFTYFDYDTEWEGVAESLTWAQLYRRVTNLAHELDTCGSTGDRAVILAPQGLEYIVAFLGALEAGRIAVPLSVPAVGVHDQRVTAVLKDASPSALLTTSAVVDSVVPYAESGGDTGPSILEIDSLDLDSRRTSTARRRDYPDIAYLQYTSGSTRTPTGVVISYRNLSANWEQMVENYVGDNPMPKSTVSWLPFFHDMGLMCGVCTGIFGGWRSEITSPIAFLQRPARWMQMLARNPQVLSAAPNFAFTLAAARTSDDDMAGLDLGGVSFINCGAERVNPATIRRFNQRFAPFNFPDTAIRPSYGLAEATVFVATNAPGAPPDFVCFEPDKLADGHGIRSDAGTRLVSYGKPHSPMVRIVDPDTATEAPADTIGEIWVHGENVSAGYWLRPAETEQTFGAILNAASPGTPEDQWLRTGDLGFFSEGELFIVGRIKDLLIVRGRNHYPDDIEATVQEISRGRAAAIAVVDEATEKLVVIVEVKVRGESSEEVTENFRNIHEQVTSAITNSHGVGVQDVVLVAPGSIPITTSGKVRRAACVQLYRDGGLQHLIQ